MSLEHLCFLVAVVDFFLGDGQRLRGLDTVENVETVDAGTYIRVHILD